MSYNSNARPLWGLSHKDNDNKFCFDISDQAFRNTSWGRALDWEFGPYRSISSFWEKNVFGSSLYTTLLKLIKKLLDIFVMVHLNVVELLFHLRKKLVCLNFSNSKVNSK